jgi:hypothetical protein
MRWISVLHRVKLPDHTDHEKILAWLNSHVSEGDQQPGLFAWAGHGWRYEVDPFSPSFHDPHVVYFDTDVSPDLISYFTLTWS